MKKALNQFQIKSYQIVISVFVGTTVLEWLGADGAARLVKL